MVMKRLPEDFRDFLSFLNKNNVKYLLLGGWAVGIYGQPRATADMDILIATDESNLDNLQKALHDFGVPAVEKDLFRESGNVFQMGKSPIRIELINEASGISIDDCYQRRNEITIDDVTVSLISREDLITNKKASGRIKDLADVENLESLPGKN